MPGTFATPVLTTRTEPAMAAAANIEKVVSTVADVAGTNKRRWRTAKPEAYRTYQAELMRQRRAKAKADKT
jgi:hypothetical protein